uniref:Uncharacterized protein n=1 Tax=Tetradesmus obliquus TaxID=3088 RepID=A0A383WPW4_TETOB
MAKKMVTVSDQQAKRYAALAALKAHKYDVGRAAKALGYTRRFVKAQLDTYKNRGNVDALPRPGRPKLLNAAQIEAAAEQVLQQQSVAKAAAVLKEQGTIASSISTETITRAVKTAVHSAAEQQQQQQQLAKASSTTKQQRVASRQHHGSDSSTAIDGTYLALSSSQGRRKKWVRKVTKPAGGKVTKPAKKVTKPAASKAKKSR